MAKNKEEKTNGGTIKAMGSSKYWDSKGNYIKQKKKIRINKQK